MYDTDTISKVVKTYCSTNNNKPNMQVPFYSNWYLYATDSFTAIRIPSEKWEETTLKSIVETIDNTFSKEVVHTYKVELSAMEELSLKFKMIPFLNYSTMVDCEFCSWEWIVECDMWCEHDCPKCEWYWKVWTPKETGEMICAERNYVLVDKTTAIDCKFFNRIISTTKELWMSEVEFQFSDTNALSKAYNIHPLTCKIWDAMVLIMPVKINHDLTSYDELYNI